MFSKVISFFQKSISALINIGTQHTPELDEKARIRVTNVAILHAILSVFAGLFFVLDMQIYVLLYLAYIIAMAFLLFFIHKKGMLLAQYLVFYVTLIHLSIFSVLSQGKMLVEYLIIIAIVVTHAEYRGQKTATLPPIIGLCCFVIIQFINKNHYIIYPLPKNQDIIFYMNLFVIVLLLFNTLRGIHKEILIHKKHIEDFNRELIEKTEALTEANALKNKLFSIIGHDLKQPFNSIQGLLELMESTNLEENTRISIVNRIRISNKTALSTLENLLQWGISIQKETKITQSVIQVAPTVNSIFEVLAETAENKQISLENQVDANLFIWINTDHLELVLRNVVANAIKFSHPKSKIIVENIALNSEKWAEIRITDYGVGIPKAQLAKLFEETEVITTQGTAREKGTGLGLMICKEFITKNDGKIAVSSVEGQGTKVSLYLKKQP